MGKMDSMSLWGFFAWLFLLLSLIGIVVMMVVLLSKGDERKKYILLQSSKVALCGGSFGLIMDVMYRIFLEQQMHFSIESSPVVYLGVFAILFDGAYLFFKRKHG